MDTTRLARKAAEEMRARTAAASMVPARRRPTWQTGLLWLTGGMALMWLAAFFLDSSRGSARRHMAFDKAMATGRDLGRRGGKKMRHLRNKAMGAVAEIKGAAEEKERMERSG